MDSFTVPAGKYYLGDPCYCFGKDWHEVLNQSDDFEQPYKKGKNVCIAFGTAYGDGEYDDQDGNSYPVDAGLIGLTAVSLASKKKPFGCRVISFDKPTECRKEGGLLIFGDIQIQTDGSDEEDDDVCSCCGR